MWNLINIFSGMYENLKFHLGNTRYREIVGYLLYKRVNIILVPVSDEFCIKHHILSLIVFWYL